MSHRRRNSRSGFALVECLISVLVLLLLVVGMAQLTVAHERLVADLERWCALDPTYYVIPSEDELERMLGYPATLSREPRRESVAPRELPVPGEYEVFVLFRTQSLHPEGASATVYIWED